MIKIITIMIKTKILKTIKYDIKFFLDISEAELMVKS